MKSVKWVRQYSFICISFMLCACSTSGKYADVMDQKMAQVRLETKDPITTLAFVPTKKLEDPEIQIVKDKTALQDIEAAAGGDDVVMSKFY